MESVLWYVLTSTRGGDNRLRLLVAADDEPRNANQFAADLHLDYKTVRHHLDVLVENDILEPVSEGYGARYRPTDKVRHHWETVEKILEEADGDRYPV
ncbi:MULTISPECIES: winged helix-turn-helix domain-containing protein [Haloprofundus]|uniref:winged helix-turn-helix domain-containing protein n=1 Tax=Haloprofundus TaxID=1911573 RepID=UPI000E43462E|nr:MULTISPECIES: winged helix-turn-helix domain-containing protein [Haloprofundus]QCJ47883.1 winged helix-turn-helix transcriptional regulator [Haloprofundus sp. MHR1]